MKQSTRASSKHALVHAWLRDAIASGRLKPGARLPSEAELMRQFSVSRITVSRAMRDLQLAGLIDRRVGAGSFVAATQASTPTHLSFGLLIPDLGETDIFEPICQGMMTSPLARDHALLWGSAPPDQTNAGSRAWHLCRQFIERRVSGVFFAPLELAPDKDAFNDRIGRALDDARIPVVLLDRSLRPYPDPGRHDLVGIDNRRAGHVMTDHLLRVGCRRVAFVARRHAAPTVDAREAGYREALATRGIPIDPALVCRIDADGADRAIATLMASSRPDGIVCANDRTAGAVLHALGRLGIGVPGDVRLVGIDDVDYAKLLPVPLTTFRQPTGAIGDAAMGVMLERVARPDRPPRDTHLHGRLVVRASCGGLRQRGPGTIS